MKRSLNTHGHSFHSTCIPSKQTTLAKEPRQYRRLPSQLKAVQDTSRLHKIHSRLTGSLTLSNNTFLQHVTDTTLGIAEFIHPGSVVASLLACLQKAKADPISSEVHINNALIGVDSSFADPLEVKKVDVYNVPAASCIEHPTIKVMLERMVNGSTPHRRRDDYKLGLVVEGGGMRGAVSGAMMMELRKLGFYNVFDAVYGSSAGAVNAAYFLTGQEIGMDIYFNHLTSKKFLDFGRMFSPEPVLDLNFLIDSIMEKAVPLKWNEVLTSRIPLKVIASSLDQLKSVTLGEFKSKEELIIALKASCTVPEIVGPPEVLDGQRLVDAAVFEPIPYKAAIQDGCTHVLALCSRPRPRGAKGRIKRVIKKIMDRAIKRLVLNPPYMKKAWKAELGKMLEGGLDADDLLLLTMIQGLHGTDPTPVDGHIFAIYPSPKYTIAPTCLDAELLRNGAKEARKAVDRLFQPLAKSIVSQKSWLFI